MLSLETSDIWQVHIIKKKKKKSLIVLPSQMSLSSLGIFVLRHAVFSISSCHGLHFNEHQITTRNHPHRHDDGLRASRVLGKVAELAGLWYFLLYRFCLDNVNPPNEAIVLLSEPIVLPRSLPFSGRPVFLNICMSVMLSTKVFISSTPHRPTPAFFFFFLIKAFIFKFMCCDAIWIHTGINGWKQYIYLSQNVISHETVV